MVPQSHISHGKKSWKLCWLQSLRTSGERRAWHVPCVSQDMMPIWKAGAGAGRRETLMVEMRPKLQPLVPEVCRGAHPSSVLE